MSLHALRIVEEIIQAEIEPLQTQMLRIRNELRELSLTESTQYLRLQNRIQTLTKVGQKLRFRIARECIEMSEEDIRREKKRS